MERIIRLNAVETSNQGENLGMKRYDFHPQKYLTPQKVSTLSINCSSVAIATPTVTVLENYWYQASNFIEDKF
ncbi:hypothetical protein H6G33_04640 [Calothrix sp. FACHB-1219]|uniref:hypothetical protein n=1 Tax=unclassified Calothrix TaxID=2619626 RepID=UPI001683A3E5|nr:MULTISPECIES: hypothetical protein [unclassified Calothrix]MBD2204861.1 hypothetical protein [Calothrix sp. FACHB-168]MBD2216313.1 hypothetical protein [Calothrix sp. FACHB-1219]